MTKFVAFMNDESGASAAEYVLILAVIGTAVAGAAFAFGTAIASALGDVGTYIKGVWTAPST